MNNHNREGWWWSHGASPKAQHQQNHRACVGLQCCKYGCCWKDALNSETWILNSNVQTG